MLATGLSYENAVQLVATLNGAGIDANITVGAVRVSPDDRQVDDAERIIKDAGASIEQGDMTAAVGARLISKAIETDKKLKH